MDQDNAMRELSSTIDSPQAYRPNDWLPTTQKEVAARGWDELDVIIISGDAYVDHPAFGHAVIARIIESEGLRVAIVPQPNWRDDLRDFKKLGKPRLFFHPLLTGSAVRPTVPQHKQHRHPHHHEPGAPHLHDHTGELLIVDRRGPGKRRGELVRGVHGIFGIEQH